MSGFDGWATNIATAAGADYCAVFCKSTGTIWGEYPAGSGKISKAQAPLILNFRKKAENQELTVPLPTIDNAKFMPIRADDDMAYVQTKGAPGGLVVIRGGPKGAHSLVYSAEKKSGVLSNPLFNYLSPYLDHE